MKRPGVVLVVVLLAVVALELLAMSAFGFAQLGWSAAAVARLDAELQAAADDAVAQAAASAGAYARDSTSGAEWPVQVLAPDGVRVTTMIRRLDARLLHVRALAVPDTRPDAGQASAGAIVGIIPPPDVLAAFPAVITSVAPRVSAPIDPATQAPCVPTALHAPTTLPPAAALPSADVAPLGDIVAISWTDAARIADAHEPAADADGLRLVTMNGPATLAGPFDGVLLVDGDLALAPGAVVAGLLAVRGTLEVAAGAQVRGAVRAAAVTGDGSIRYDRCAVEAALNAPALVRGYRPVRRWRVPAF